MERLLILNGHFCASRGFSKQQASLSFNDEDTDPTQDRALKPSHLPEFHPFKLVRLVVGWFLWGAAAVAGLTLHITH